MTTPYDVTAALALGASLALLLGPATGSSAVAGGPRRGLSARRAAAGAVGVALVAAVLGDVRLVVAAVLVLACAGGGARLVAARRRERAATWTRRQVVELCDALQGELAAGQPADLALAHAAAEWPAVAPAARAAATGGDVPGTLRGLAGAPGADMLRVVAAAWQVAHRTGHGLAEVLGRVAEDLRAAEQTRRVVTGELASARATARLLAVLPLFALALGAAAGARPWEFLLGHPVGLACLTAGLTCGYAGLAWIEGLARDVAR